MLANDGHRGPTVQRLSARRSDPRGQARRDRERAIAVVAGRDGAARVPRSPAPAHATEKEEPVSEGVETILLETHNFGKTVKFWQQLGYTLQFETDHHSGLLVNKAGGPDLFVAERPPQ